MILDPVIFNTMTPCQAPELITVVNKVTREVRCGVPDNCYPTDDWVHNPDQSLIDSGYWKVSGEIIVAMDQSEKDALDLELLEASMECKFLEIDRRTQALIGNGFAFDSHVFSLSPAAQAKLMGVNQVRDNQNVAYPIKWNSKNDKATRDITEANDMLSFYLTAVGTYRAHVDSGTTLKDTIRAATTVAAVNAVTDSR